MRMDQTGYNELPRQIRGSMCNICGQRLSVPKNTTEVVRCPACKFGIAVPTFERLSSTGHGGGDGRQIWQSAVAKVKNNASEHEHKRIKQPMESLNCNPSPLRAPLSSSEAGPIKRALLIGVTYKGQKFWLKGTVNDVRNMRSFLIDHFHFRPQNILVLTEEEQEHDLIPTKKNIEKALEWLVDGCRPGDSLVFYFSGHGQQQPDSDDDELDGFDEAICPVDYLQEGMILDNVINSTIVQPLKKGVTLHAIVDACHSGTILDLSFVYNREKNRWDDNRPPSGVRKHTEGGLAISISACEDSEQAMDTPAFSGSKKAMNGAVTYVLIDIATKYPKVTYGELLDLMNGTFAKANQEGCLAARMLRTVFNDNFSQTPQLSASEAFDVYLKHFTL